MREKTERLFHFLTDDQNIDKRELATVLTHEKAIDKIVSDGFSVELLKQAKQRGSVEFLESLKTS